MHDLSSADLKWLEERFANYEHYEKEITRRKFELNYKPENQTPEIQKQPSTQSQVENFVIKVTMDDYINDRLRWKNGVERVMNKANDDLNEMIVCKFKEYPYYSWEEVACHLNHSTAKIYRMRYKVLYMLAKEIDYI